MEDRDQRNPLRKAVRVLNWMVEALPEDVGVREMAQGLPMAPSSVHRVLNMLESEGLVRGDGDSGRYRLGVEFFRLAWRATARFPIANVALPIMRELTDVCNETSLLGIYDPVQMKMVFAASVESQHPLRYVVELNTWVPVHVGASGLAIMAFLPEVERRAIAARTGLPPITTGNTLTDPVRLEQELERVRARGYACSHGQRIPGAVGLGAPIWGPDGRVVGDLQLTMPEQRFDPGAEQRLGQLLIQYARRITEQLGGRMPARERS